MLLIGIKLIYLIQSNIGAIFNIDFINIIIMLRRIVKPALSIFSLIPKATLFNGVRPSYSFSSDIKASSNLRGLLDKEIKYEEENVEDLKEQISFLESQGFKITYDGIQVELSKKIGLYNVRVIFFAKTPMGQDAEQEGQQQQQQGNEDADYAEISAFIQKDGSSQWLTLEFAANSKQSQLTTASFIEDYENEKAERKKGRATQTGYLGPELSSLDQSLEEGIYSFIESVGITNELLTQVFQFSIAYEHQFYVKWLKDLKSLV